MSLHGMQLLVSMRNMQEALAAVAAGAHIINLKGTVPLTDVHAIVHSLRSHGFAQLVSATVGDWPSDAVDAIMQRVHETATCSINYVKVGVAPCADAVARIGSMRNMRHAVDRCQH